MLVRAGLRARQDIGARANRVAPDGHSARDGAFQPQERTNQREVRTPGLRAVGSGASACLLGEGGNPFRRRKGRHGVTEVPAWLEGAANPAHGPVIS